MPSVSRSPSRPRRVPSRDFWRRSTPVPGEVAAFFSLQLQLCEKTTGPPFLSRRLPWKTSRLPRLSAEVETMTKTWESRPKLIPALPRLGTMTKTLVMLLVVAELTMTLTSAMMTWATIGAMISTTLEWTLARTRPRRLMTWPDSPIWAMSPVLLRCRLLASLLRAAGRPTAPMPLTTSPPVPPLLPCNCSIGRLLPATSWS
mmetsp:Transcript_3934/g.11172  ORF Transcript_3934/g.11172 Transcript_3934/m.11172 type:complete len:202 (-) Transcript_3934:877-1482(-)